MQEVSSNNTPSVLVEPPPHQPISNESSCPVAKTKRKARSTRRRLNAMMSNASLHFSDTDSEGELSVPRISMPNHSVKNAAFNGGTGNLLHPVISVTLDGSDDSSYGGGNERRNSFLENLTDVDEIYTSEPENDAKTSIKSVTSTPRGSLTVGENPHLGETDLEDMSNDDEEVVQAPIFIKPRSDILVDFNGETITTKEGDGPFSIEVRNQMSIDEEAKDLDNDTPDIVVMPTTDSEDMEASDEDEEGEACGQSKESYEAFDVLAASQIVMRNVDKMEQQLLRVKSPSGGAEDGGINESHTDVEDIE
ncbi:hypothetical protein TSAR_011006 [Trichomalopsis sarcophagae]|uniref:Uncharacterized protein n=1 Tax=Trichomalopsis sarcophagae TaxID=543379 RepID=A0A232F4Q3_9HYME|nr:hypothetical protein TSAR_011006 [Trichomalopsis sarcophagae]